MSKVTEALEQEYDDLYDTEIGDEDYGFIFGPDGELKSVFLPNTIPNVTPEKIQKILEIFGINDIENIDGSQTIH